MIRVVLDAVVFVRGLMNPLGRWGHLIFDRSPDYRLLVSPPVLQEVLEVIQRPRLVRKYRGLATQNLRDVIRTLDEAEGVEIDLTAFPRICRDAKDDIYLATAKAGNAAFIVNADPFLGILDTLRTEARGDS